MREIKFKAIIIGNETIITPPIDWTDFENKTCGWTTYHEGTGEFEEHEAYYERLLQYTGHKDINKKEIYEGDILKRKVIYEDPFTNEKNEIIEMGYVKYIENDCCFKVIDEKNGTLHSIKNNFKIIGNIYEDYK